MEKFISNAIVARYGIEGNETELVLEYDNTINCSCEVPAGTQEVNLVLEPLDAAAVVTGHTGALAVKEGVNYFQSTLDAGEKGTYTFVMSVMVQKSKLASGLVCLLVDEQKATMISAEDNAYHYEYVLPHQTEKINVEPVVNDPSVVISGDVGEVPVYGSCQMSITLSSPKAAEELKIYLDITDPFAEQKLTAPPAEAPVTVAPELLERPIAVSAAGEAQPVMPMMQPVMQPAAAAQPAMQPVMQPPVQPAMQPQPFAGGGMNPMMPAASAGKGDDLSNIRNIMTNMGGISGMPGGQPPVGGPGVSAPAVDFNVWPQAGGNAPDPLAGFNPSWGVPPAPAAPAAPRGQALPLLRSLTVFSVGGGKSVDVDKLKRMVSQADQNALSSMDRKAHLTTAVLQPEFSRENTVYTTYVSGDVTAVYISAAPEDPMSGSVSGDLNYQELREGENGFSISVSSQNTVNTYRLTVVKARSNDPQVEAQMWQVQEAMNMNAPGQQGAAAFAPQGGQAAAAAAFQEGAAAMAARPAAGDKKAMRNPRLDRLDVSIGHLKPAFSPDKLKYTLVLPAGEAPATVTFRAAAQAEGAAISGNDGENRVNAGKNTYNIICTAPDGKRSRTYTVTMHCKAAKAAPMPGGAAMPAPPAGGPAAKKKQKSGAAAKKRAKQESAAAKPKRVYSLKERLAVFCLAMVGLAYVSYQFLYVPSVTSFDQNKAEYNQTSEEREALELIMANANGYQKKMDEFGREMTRMESEIPSLPTQQEILRDLHTLQEKWDFRYDVANVGQVSRVELEQMTTIIATYGLDPEQYAIQLPASEGDAESEAQTGTTYLPNMRQAMLKISIQGGLETVLDVYTYFIGDNGTNDRKYTIGNIIISQESDGVENWLGDVGDRVRDNRERVPQWSIAFDVDYYSYTG